MRNDIIFRSDRKLIYYFDHEKFSLEDLMRDSPKEINSHHWKLGCCTISYPVVVPFSYPVVVPFLILSVLRSTIYFLSAHLISQIPV